MAWLDFSDELYNQIINTSQEEERNPGTLITADIWNYTISTIHYNIKEIADLLKAHTHILWEDVEDKPAVLANIGENEAGEFTHNGIVLREWANLLNKPAVLANLTEISNELAYKGTVLRRWDSILNKPEVLAHLSEDAAGNLLYKGKIVIPYDGTIEIPPPVLPDILTTLAGALTEVGSPSTIVTNKPWVFNAGAQINKAGDTTDIASMQDLDALSATIDTKIAQYAAPDVPCQVVLSPTITLTGETGFYIGYTARIQICSVTIDANSEGDITIFSPPLRYWLSFAITDKPASVKATLHTPIDGFDGGVIIRLTNTENTDVFVRVFAVLLINNWLVPE